MPDQPAVRMLRVRCGSPRQGPPGRGRRRRSARRPGGPRYGTLFQQITEQLEAQRQGSDEIVQSIITIAQTSETTTQSTEEVSATATQLAGTAGRLREAIARFTL